MVYVILANGFEEIEALTAVDVLRRAGAEVRTVGITGRVACGAHGIPVTCDVTFDELDERETPELLVLPGGMPGAANIDGFYGTDGLIKKTLDGGGYVGAICAAPLVPGKRGLLAGRRAVCFPGFEEYLTGAEITDCDVVRDGQFVTSKCMGTALPFAIELVSCLYGREKAEKVKASVMAQAD
ncbi:MAG: DJ-1/PfpI family protein [Clostridia bacterium]|nr:DJ-1/PfpI family protein [Clostridia bacterium]